MAVVATVAATATVTATAAGAGAAGWATAAGATTAGGTGLGLLTLVQEMALLSQLPTVSPCGGVPTLP